MKKKALEHFCQEKTNFHQVKILSHRSALHLRREENERRKRGGPGGPGAPWGDYGLPDF